MRFGAGLRKRKSLGSDPATTAHTHYAYSGSKVVAEYTSTGTSPTTTLVKEYIYAGSQLVASLSGSTPTYMHADHLSARVFTNSAGNKVGERGHYPFGETWYDTMSTDKWKFTTYERDSESGLDYAIFRFDSSRLGRFQSPDPVAGSRLSPQSLNRYTYTMNDPINLMDPLGLEVILVCNYVPEMRWFPIESGDGGPSGVWAPIGWSTECFNYGTVGWIDSDRPGSGGKKAPIKNRVKFDKNKGTALGLLGGNCGSWLSSMGIDICALEQAINNQQPWDAGGSTLTMQEAGFLTPADVAQLAPARAAALLNQSVGDYFRQMQGIVSVRGRAVLGGRDVYYWKESFSPRNIIHESMHNMGYDDDQLRDMLNPTCTGSASACVDQALKDHGCT